MLNKKILVALDDSKNSKNALNYAIYLARQNKTKLTGIHVLPKTPKKKYQNLKYPEKHSLKTADKIMEDAKIKSAKKGILFEKKISFGETGSSIIKFAKSLNYDIIIIGSRGMGYAKDIFFGSVSNYIIHKSQIPVLIVK